ncbi:MAG: hypothetical protein N2578_07355 [Bdellovibrionaceae bacterium]|nr:hypothetical protein [Pseudobdellovibrionaceae bacterium]
MDPLIRKNLGKWSFLAVLGALAAVGGYVVGFWTSPHRKQDRINLLKENQKPTEAAEREESASVDPSL